MHFGEKPKPSHVDLATDITGANSTTTFAASAKPFFGLKRYYSKHVVLSCYAVLPGKHGDIIFSREVGHANAQNLQFKGVVTGSSRILH